MTPTETIARLLAEWGPGKVRALCRGLWWCWDGCGYTGDTAQAGLYDADWKPGRPEDSVVPVDPDTNAFDALIARLKWGGLRAQVRQQPERRKDRPARRIQFQ